MILATLETARYTFTAAADTDTEAADLLRRAWAKHAEETDATYTWDELSPDVNYLGVEAGMVLRDGFVVDLPEAETRPTMDLARALAILTGTAVPREQPEEYGQAAGVALDNLGVIEQTLRRMGHAPEQARNWTDHLRRTVGR